MHHYGNNGGNYKFTQGQYHYQDQSYPVLQVQQPQTHWHNTPTLHEQNVLANAQGLTAVANRFSGSQYARPAHPHYISDMLIAYVIGSIAGAIYDEYYASKHRYDVRRVTRKEMRIKQRTGRWLPDIAVEDLYPWRKKLLQRLEYARTHDGLVPNEDYARPSVVGMGTVILGLRMIDDDIAVTGARP
jgi:hypothetical protein